jgi:hypothetical protein
VDIGHFKPREQDGGSGLRICFAGQPWVEARAGRREGSISKGSKRPPTRTDSLKLRGRRAVD